MPPWKIAATMRTPTITKKISIPRSCHGSSTSNMSLSPFSAPLRVRDRKCLLQGPAACSFDRNIPLKTLPRFALAKWHVSIVAFETIEHGDNQDRTQKHPSRYTH